MKKAMWCVGGIIGVACLGGIHLMRHRALEENIKRAAEIEAHRVCLEFRSNEGFWSIKHNDLDRSYADADCKKHGY